MCPLFLPFEVFIDLDDPVAFRFMTGSVQWTVCAILCLVSFDGLYKSGTGLVLALPDVIHDLTHWTDIAILLLIVVKLTSSKRILAALSFILLPVKHPVFDKRSDLLLFE